MNPQLPESYVDMEIRYPRRSLRDFYYILFRHKWKVILFFLAVMATVTLGVFLASKVYRAEARLLVRIGRESVTLDPTAATGQVISIGQSRESEINSELEILKSRWLAQKVVDAVGPEKFLEPPDADISGEASLAGRSDGWTRHIRERMQSARQSLWSFMEGLDLVTPLDQREKATLRLMKSLEIETQKNNNTISLSFEEKSPKFAQTVLAALIDLYLEKHINIHRTAGSYEFFQRQAEQLRANLSTMEEGLRSLKNRSGVSSLEEQRRVLLTRTGSLQQESEATQAALAISQSKVRTLEEKLAKLSPSLVTQETTGTGNYGADLMRARLYELELKEQELLSKYTESSELVREVRRQKAEAQAVLAKEETTRTHVTTGVNTVHQQMSLALLTEVANLSSLQSKAGVLKGQLADAQRELRELNDTEVRMVNLQRELALQEAKYKKYSENLEQARIDQALEMNKISNISVVQPATASSKPVKPNKAITLGLGLILGLLGGIGLAFFSDYLDHSLKSPQELQERVEIQILASIPYSRKRQINGPLPNLIGGTSTREQDSRNAKIFALTLSIVGVGLGTLLASGYTPSFLPSLPPASKAVPGFLPAPALVPQAQSQSYPIPPAPASTMPPAERALPLAPASTVPQAAPPSRVENRMNKTVSVKKGENIFSICRSAYGLGSPSLVDYILEFNPQIHNYRLIKVHQKIIIPTISEEILIKESREGGFRVRLGTFTKPEFANAFKTDPVLKGKEIEVIPRHVSPGETWYQLWAGNIETREAGQQVIKVLKEKKILP